MPESLKDHVLLFQSDVANQQDDIEPKDNAMAHDLKVEGAGLMMLPGSESVGAATEPSGRAARQCAWHVDTRRHSIAKTSPRPSPWLPP